ncbi:hypothetical protein QU481_11140 [Crenobacter sp. SG2303]|uniref:Surface-adhesin protein E-like domain-containing protein n=1 Tax=Crenobacter oryzisoli TaxID=3056844 RepID=A0ABT7XNV0_9NEIS|nr:surface-adhesin E family protein [Crenobacter sp. SG2303]MDN0075446.1 hypothetical protein [Crenobacter sp. SG2303]
MKTWYLIALATVAAPALASPSHWQTAGKTNNGNIVQVDSANMSSDGDVIHARLRVEYKPPVTVGKIGLVSSMHIDAAFRCRTMETSARQLVMYHDERKNDVALREDLPPDGFGQEPDGSIGDVALHYLCRGYATP